MHWEKMKTFCIRPSEISSLCASSSCINDSANKQTREQAGLELKEKVMDLTAVERSTFFDEQVKTMAMIGEYTVDVVA